MAGRFYRSRLEKRSQRNQWRQTFVWGGLTILVLVGLVVFGFPLFIRIAGWYGDWKTSESPISRDDRVSPAPPRLNVPFDATSSAVLNLSGFAESGSTIDVFVNQELVKTVVAEADGSFFASNLQLDKGFNSIYATATDQAENVSAESRKEEVIFDNQPPELTVEKPLSESRFYGRSEKRIEVRGLVDADAQVTVNGRLVIVDQLGRFSTFVSLNDGEQVISVLAVDKAGNETKEELKVTYSS